MQLKYFGNAYGKWMVPTNKWQRTWPVDSWYRRGDPLVRGWVHSLAFVAGTYLYLGVGVLASSLFSGVSDFWDRTRILKCGNPSNWMCLTAYEFSFDFLVSSFFVCLFTFFSFIGYIPSTILHIVWILLIVLGKCWFNFSCPSFMLY